MKNKKLILLFICFICFSFISCSSSDSKSNNELLEINTPSIASINNSLGNDGMSDVNIKLIKIIRGDEAQALVDKFNQNSSLKINLSYMNKNDLEFGICDIELTIPNDLNVPEEGISPILDVKITGSNKEDLVYNKFKYPDLPGTFISNFSNVKNGETVTCSYAFTIPKNCKDYAIAIGNEYFKRIFYKGL
ncbi:MAG: hypothetical protein SOZ71_09585 [Clostridium sp.]|nr:hypothetical protein [Clostridium sp.]